MIVEIKGLSGLYTLLENTISTGNHYFVCSNLNGNVFKVNFDKILLICQ